LSGTRALRMVLLNESCDVERADLLISTLRDRLQAAPNSEFRRRL
jgi:hypothetical protein